MANIGSGVVPQNPFHHGSTSQAQHQTPPPNSEGLWPFPLPGSGRGSSDGSRTLGSTTSSATHSQQASGEPNRAAQYHLFTENFGTGTGLTGPGGAFLTNLSSIDGTFQYQPVGDIRQFPNVPNRIAPSPVNGQFAVQPQPWTAAQLPQGRNGLPQTNQPAYQQRTPPGVPQQNAGAAQNQYAPTQNPFLSPQPSAVLAFPSPNSTTQAIIPPLPTPAYGAEFSGYPQMMNFVSPTVGPSPFTMMPGNHHPAQQFPPNQHPIFFVNAPGPGGATSGTTGPDLAGVIQAAISASAAFQGVPMEVVGQPFAPQGGFNVLPPGVVNVIPVGNGFLVVPAASTGFGVPSAGSGAQGGGTPSTNNGLAPSVFPQQNSVTTTAAPTAIHAANYQTVAQHPNPANHPHLLPSYTSTTEPFPSLDPWSVLQSNTEESTGTRERTVTAPAPSESGAPSHNRTSSSRTSRPAHGAQPSHNPEGQATRKNTAAAPGVSATNPTLSPPHARMRMKGSPSWPRTATADRSNITLPPATTTATASSMDAKSSANPPSTEAQPNAVKVSTVSTNPVPQPTTVVAPAPGSGSKPRSRPISLIPQPTSRQRSRSANSAQGPPQLATAGPDPSPVSPANPFLTPKHSPSSIQVQSISSPGAESPSDSLLGQSAPLTPDSVVGRSVAHENPRPSDQPPVGVNREGTSIPLLAAPTIGTPNRRDRRSNSLRSVPRPNLPVLTNPFSTSAGPVGVQVTMGASSSTSPPESAPKNVVVDTIGSRDTENSPDTRNQTGLPSPPTTIPSPESADSRVLAGSPQTPEGQTGPFSVSTLASPLGTAGNSNADSGPFSVDNSHHMSQDNVSSHLSAIDGDGVTDDKLTHQKESSVPSGSSDVLSDLGGHQSRMKRIVLDTRGVLTANGLASSNNRVIGHRKSLSYDYGGSTGELDAVGQRNKPPRLLQLGNISEAFPASPTGGFQGSSSGATPSDGTVAEFPYTSGGTKAVGR
ncbi:hypothetical protein M427DRAFT_30552 [Gonapodya prolifera JEL478]|uniref:Uncharacterized protein n=1 Tax=Gonapodya prolifera (strain JEL478) TaxID=1344416 RepID=A0A139AKV6_GONPJ|nr:hypothetical protein M427DRAFT_30552 [Gonapodya prolifera JEL478]|eukprot:KXS17431.1 hypothetical protein M427DRAFT_30552 [Gonapodya prolifera JEL478]